MVFSFLKYVLAKLLVLGFCLLVLLVLAMYPYWQFEYEVLCKAGSTDDNFWNRYRCTEQIGEIGLHIEITPHRDESYNGFLCYKRISAPYTLNFFATSEDLPPTELQISEVHLNVEGSEPINAVSQPIVIPVRQAFHWKNATSVPIPDLDFKDGKKVKLIVKAVDPTDNSAHIFEVDYVEKYYRTWANLAMQ